jgi:hypothetical protein
MTAPAHAASARTCSPAGNQARNASWKSSSGHALEHKSFMTIIDIWSPHVQTHSLLSLSVLPSSVTSQRTGAVGKRRIRGNNPFSTLFHS